MKAVRNQKWFIADKNNEGICKKSYYCYVSLKPPQKFF